MRSAWTDRTEYRFDLEKPEASREAIAFASVAALLEGSVRFGDRTDQWDRAATSLPPNIAERNGKYGPKDRCRSFTIAHGSALERAAGPDVLVDQEAVDFRPIRPGKERLQRIVKVRPGRIERNSTRDYDRGGRPPDRSPISCIAYSS